MFDLGLIFGAGDLVSDVAGIKQRKARQLKFFRYKKGNYGIAFYDNKTVYGEYWLENIPVPKEYENKLKYSGFKIGKKYDVQLLGISHFDADKEVLKTPAIQKRLLKTIFESFD